MAENTEDNDIMSSNCFSNPNYGLNNADAINSNLPVTPYFDDNGHSIYEDVDSPDMGDYATIGGTTDPTITSTNSSSKSRKKYAQMDLTSMGIEIGDQTTHGDLPLVHSLSSPDSVRSQYSEGRVSCDSAVTTPMDKSEGSGILEVEHTADDTEDESPYAETVASKGFLGYYASLERSAKAREEEKEAKIHSNGKREDSPASQDSGSKDNKTGQSYDDKTKVINSPDSNDSGIQADVPHIHGPINDDIYATVNKPKKSASKEDLDKASEEDEGDKDSAEVLPPGWERCEDEDGAYYWHIKSGTIQRDPPPPPPPDYKEHPRKSTSSGNASESTSSSVSTPPETPSSSDHLHEFEGHAFKYATESLKSLAKTKEESKVPQKEGAYPIRFAVRSLGWVRIAEEDLTPERSSKAVNKCIVDLSLGRNDINDVVGRWGDGKDLYMDLDSENLTLTDPQDMSLLNVQPIQSIRVWGVGRDNGRDFAYVARDLISRRHMCHVFRCDTPARQIANTLRDICKKIMMERSLQQTTASMQKIGVSRPTDLPNLERFGAANGQKLTYESLIKNTSFPTPMEEPKKVLRCHYLGTAQVPRPTGVEVLNSAMEKVHARVPPEKWVFVSVGVAPSTITITEHGKPDNILAECRVRFLSFMGIALRNVKLCGFIMHTAQEQFIAHVFHCEPSAGAVCKTIEAACKLRYQKCLDSHQRQMAAQKTAAQTHSKESQAQGQTQGVSATLKAGVQNVTQSVMGMFKKKSDTPKS